MAEELWHYVEARRDDGAASMFRIRELDPRLDLPKIFVVELPYATTELSRLPSATSHRRLADFEESWLRPACTSLGWEIVGTKTEDGSCFFYMYGAATPEPMVGKLAPFDAALGFYDDDDPTWGEYATLRELLDQAKAIPEYIADDGDSDHDHPDHDHTGHDHSPAPAPARKRKATVLAKPVAAKKKPAKKKAKKPAVKKKPTKKPAKKPRRR